MSKPKRSVWDDIVELGREVIENFDDIFNPDKRRKPAPVSSSSKLSPGRENNDRQYS